MKYKLKIILTLSMFITETYGKIETLHDLKVKEENKSPPFKMTKQISRINNKIVRCTMSFCL